MKTYQDFLAIESTDEEIMKFVSSAISEYKLSDLYKTACVAKDYYDHKNRTIREFQKLLYTVAGGVVPDNYSANWKMASNFFYRFLTQENQYLLGNGVSWKNDSTKQKLGKDFDTVLQDAGEAALWGAVSYGYYSLGNTQVFTAMEFAPLFDEENGALKGGVRFWQIDDSKPLRATFYELDGFTEYMWKKGKVEILSPKHGYVAKKVSSKADGTRIYDYENYPTFPIVPLWANKSHQSEIVGLREQIDCYDLIKSGFANDVDDASLIYWTINNAGGMDDIDLAKFVERMRTLHAVAMEDDGAQAAAHTVDLPYQSREALLDRLRSDLYEDAMALDTKALASGGEAVTASIIAAYKPLDSKCDKYEYCVLKFLDGILKLAGIEDEAPTFTRSMMINRTEEINSLLSAADYLTEDYVARKVLEMFGDGDKAEDIIKETQKSRVTEALGSFKEEAELSESAEPSETVGRMINGVQFQGMMTIVAQYTAGQLTQAQAKLLLRRFGFTDSEAQEFLTGEGIEKVVESAEQ